jgi:hypothetical protein
MRLCTSDADADEGARNPLQFEFEMALHFRIARRRSAVLYFCPGTPS